MNSQSLLIVISQDIASLSTSGFKEQIPFDKAYKENLIIGIKLNLLIILMVLITAEGLWTGYQIWRINIWGMLYMMLGIIIAFVVITAIVHIPPVLSYFEAPVSSVIRMAVYFAIRKPLRSILFTLLFVLMLYFIEAFPLALLIVPALYGDLIRAPLNRDFMIFAKENNLETDNSEEISEEEETISEQSTYDLDRILNKKEKNKK